MGISIFCILLKVLNILKRNDIYGWDRIIGAQIFHVSHAYTLRCFPHTRHRPSARDYVSIVINDLVLKRPFAGTCHRSSLDVLVRGDIECGRLRFQNKIGTHFSNRPLRNGLGERHTRVSCCLYLTNVHNKANLCLVKSISCC